MIQFSFVIRNQIIVCEDCRIDFSCLPGKFNRRLHTPPFLGVSEANGLISGDMDLQKLSRQTLELLPLLLAIGESARPINSYKRVPFLEGSFIQSSHNSLRI